MEDKREVVIVVTLDGVFGFIGVKSEKTSADLFVLDNALTVGYYTDGTAYPVFGQLPVGTADPTKPMETCIPMSNVSYAVVLKEGDGHSLVDQYFEFFKPKPEGFGVDGE